METRFTQQNSLEAFRCNNSMNLRREEHGNQVNLPLVGTCKPMEDQVVSAGSGSVTTETDSSGADLQILCTRVKVLEQRASSNLLSESHLRNRIRETVKLERSLLLRLHQLASASQRPSMQLDQRLHMLREEVRTMTQEKERGERVWRERLQRCQKQLKAKEEEMSRQSLYFENFKTQLQHKLSLGRDREQSLQNRIYTLEKQLLDMTVSAATGTATVGAVRITAGTGAMLQDEREKLTSMREEGEGEEERKEERMKRSQPSASAERDGRQEGDDGKSESRLQSFILSLQEDLRVLLERAADGATEQRELTERLHKAQENGLFLGNKVEELRAEVQQLKLSESSLLEEVEELREENHRLQLISRGAAEAESACESPGPSSAQVHPIMNGGTELPHPPAVPPKNHQVTAEVSQNTSDCAFRSLPFTSETVDELNLEGWCCRGILDVEQSPSEESDALRDAYKSLGLGEDLEALREQRDRLEEELEVVAQENMQLKSQLRKQEGELAAAKGLSRDTDDRICSSSTQNVGQDDLAQALNQENRALAERIQELLTHIELREEEIRVEQSQQRERASGLQEDRHRLEQEVQEHGCLITELTRKTEDDLNTIMELRQMLEERENKQGNEEVTLESVEPQLNQEADDLISPGFQPYNQHDLSQSNRESSLHVGAPNEEARHLTEKAQSLKAEQEELMGSLNSLREQQREVALTVQTKTEEKQQLTRSVWGLKEERDGVSQSLSALRQEKEQLNRSICGLRDNRDQLLKSVSGLEEEKEQLMKTITGLGSEKEALRENVLGGREERDQITRRLQSLQSEREQLNAEVLQLKRERDEIAASVKCSRGERGQEGSSRALQDERDALIQSLHDLRDKRERAERSIASLKQEEEEVTLVIQRLREERRSLGSESHGQTQTQERKQRMVKPNIADSARMIEGLLGIQDAAAQKCQSDNVRGNSLQEQSDLLTEIEALGSKLQRSQEELDQSHIQTQNLQVELCQSEARTEQLERTAAEKTMRLEHVTTLMEENRRDNESLHTRVRELQNKVTGVVRERNEALTQKRQTEEQYNVLTAQLKAKTVALDELNSEYMALKREQSSITDLSAVLKSVRSRYNDIRVKYDALLKKSSLTDLDSAPLKAKLSCLVMKCQERNGVLAQMMRTMNGRGCADPALTQHVERLLADAALLDYTNTFAPESIAVDAGDRSALTFTPRFVSTFANMYTSGLGPARARNGFTPEAAEFSLSPTSSTELPDCRSEVTEISPVQGRTSTAASAASTKSRIITTTQLPAAHGTVPTLGVPQKPGFHWSDEKSSSTRSSWSPTPLPPPPPPPPRPLPLAPRSSPSPRVSLGKRLSSPEKIINLHQQLQKTLMSSCQAPVSRGRRHEPRKSLSFSAPADLNLTGLSSNKQSLIHSEAAAVNKSPTLFNAVASRSASVTFSPDTFARHFKPNAAQRTSSSSGSSDRTTSASNSRDDAPEVLHMTPLTVGINSFDSGVSTCPDTDLISTASYTSPPTASGRNVSHGAAPDARDGLVSAASCARFGGRSPEGRPRSNRKSPAAFLQTKPTRPRPGAPAQVRSVEVIKRVGQSSLLIGWERPPLDELGCSNATFVYGYRVFIDGGFHKSVMSSACTKCIVENVDLSVPIHISVQTLGSNGLTSDSVHTVYTSAND